MAVSPIGTYNNTDSIEVSDDIKKDLLDELETYYSYVLDSSHLNMADPIAANIGYFNNSGKVWIDGPKLGRTLIYVTRPNMNFQSSDNILKCRAFNYILSSKLGITLARQLMFSPLAGKVNYGGYSELDMTKTGGLVAPTTFESTDSNGNKSSAIGFDNYVGGMEVVQSKMGYDLDNTNFITLLTNTCTETSNAKDLILDVDETEGDYSGNRLVYGAGLDESTGPGEITLTFDDLYGSPVMNLMILWVYYIHYVSKGICTPHYEYLINRIIDYTCSIYVFMLDTDQQTILRWVKYGGCFPKSIPFGQILHTKEPNLQALSQIQIPFQYNFACPMDPLVLAEFNMIAEPAFLSRKNSDGKTVEQYDQSHLQDGKAYFARKNHVMDETTAWQFTNDFPPTNAPQKLLEAKGRFQSGINRAANLKDATPGNLYNTRPNDKGIVGSDKEDPTGDIGVSGFYGPKMFNRYYGQMSYDRNFSHPYIVAGNKLMFL